MQCQRIHRRSSEWPWMNDLKWMTRCLICRGRGCFSTPKISLTLHRLSQKYIAAPLLLVLPQIGYWNDLERITSSEWQALFSDRWSIFRSSISDVNVNVNVRLIKRSLTQSQRRSSTYRYILYIVCSVNWLIRHKSSNIDVFELLHHAWRG